MRYLILVVFTFSVLLIVGCGESGEMNAGEMKKKKDVVPVEISKVKRGDIQDMLQFNATLETENTVKIFSRLEGTIVNKPLEEGTFVSKGQVLTELDGREQRLAKEKALINYDKQKNEFARMEALHKKELISVEEYDKAKLTLGQMRVEFESAKLNYDYTRIKSPISGVVSKRLVNMGDRVSPGMEIYEVVNLKEKIAKIYVPENYLLMIRNGITAKFIADVHADKVFTGYVKRISPVVDPTSGTFKVTVAVKDNENFLKPGMFVNVQLVTDTHENTLYIPKTALVFNSDKAFFYTVEKDSIAIKHELKKGFEDNARVEILNPVDAGSHIIIVGQSGLKDSAQVKIVAGLK